MLYWYEKIQISHRVSDFRPKKFYKFPSVNVTKILSVISNFCNNLECLLDQDGKLCQGQKLLLITKIRKLQTKKFYNIGPWFVWYKALRQLQPSNFSLIALEVGWEETNPSNICFFPLDICINIRKSCQRSTIRQQ